MGPSILSTLYLRLLHHFVQLIFLPSANEVCEGYVFTRVCHSVQLGGGGGALGPDPGGRLGGLAGGVSRPIPRGVVGGPGRKGGLGPGPGGCPGPGLGVVCVSQHALRQTSPPQTATAAGGTHPTGMHSCLELNQ